MSESEDIWTYISRAIYIQQLLKELTNERSIEFVKLKSQEKEHMHLIQILKSAQHYIRNLKKSMTDVTLKMLLIR